MEQIEIVFVVVSAVCFGLLIVMLTYCCATKRRTPAVKKMFIRLTQPRPSFCTLVSNNAPYQRVLEEYEIKLMDYNQFDELDSNSHTDQTKTMSKNPNYGKKAQLGKDGPRFQTSVEFPQWKMAKNNQRVRSQYNL